MTNISAAAQTCRALTANPEPFPSFAPSALGEREFCKGIREDHYSALSMDNTPP